jgi:hypothetical protein
MDDAIPDTSPVPRGSFPIHLACRNGWHDFEDPAAAEVMGIRVNAMAPARSFHTAAT